MLKEKNLIINWLNQFSIDNYTLIENFEYGYVVNVDGYVHLQFKNLDSIPVKFNEVSDDFNCASNNLSSLKGSPNHVGGFFDCRNNKLRTLEYCPQIIKEDLYCQNNLIETFSFLPKTIGDNFHIGFSGNEKYEKLLNKSVATLTELRAYNLKDELDRDLKTNNLEQKNPKI